MYLEEEDWDPYWDPPEEEEYEDPCDDPINMCEEDLEDEEEE